VPSLQPERQLPIEREVAQGHAARNARSALAVTSRIVCQIPEGDRGDFGAYDSKTGFHRCPQIDDHEVA
jgi:hypothetical protein